MITPVADVALAPLCTMHVGGPARWFVEARSESDVIDALHWARERAVAVHVLGGGSNVVVADAGVDALVVRIDLRGVESVEVGSARVFTAAAGEPWDAFVARAVDEHCAGIECLSGIPGLVGGTPIQNVGAYGQDVSATITQVTAIDRERAARVTFSTGECAFGYRTSRFKTTDRDRYIVTQVVFGLVSGGPPTVAYADLIDIFAGAETPPTLAAVRHATIDVRRRKGMVIEPDNPARHSCGSFFVNPVISKDDLARVQSVAGAVPVPAYPVSSERFKVPAAWLIERAGFARGYARGAVGISPFQAQGLINRGGAEAGDVVALAADIKSAVWRHFGVGLVPEPVFVGFAPSRELAWLLGTGDAL